MRTFLLGLVVMGLCACSSAPKKQYIVPDNEFVGDCARQCNVAKLSCKRDAADRRDGCLQANRYRQLEYQRCVNAGEVFCIKPEACPINNSQHCNITYDECFLGCGGQIVVEEKPAS